MASPSIPVNIIIGLTKIATLPDDSFQELVAAFENYPLNIQQQTIFEDVDLHFEFLSPDEVKGIKEAIFPIYRAAAAGKASETTYVDSVIQTLREHRHEGLEWIDSEELVARFRERLMRLVRVERLILIVKAHNVLTAHSQAYFEARVLSDIRLVFDEKVEDPPKAAVIVHMLNLSYYREANKHKITFALDAKDIDDLITVLQRAKAKTESLKSVIASTNLPYVEVK